MKENRSKLRPQSPYWYEDLPARTMPLKVGDANDTPDLDLDLNYVDENVFELSRATSIQRGPGLLLGGGVAVGFVAMLPFLVGIYTDDDVKNYIFMALIVFLMLMGLVVLVLYVLKKCLRTPLDLPILFDRRNQKVFALEYLVRPNPFSKWKTVVKEFDWSRVEAELGKIAGYNGKTYSVRYGLIIAQCEAGTTKVEDRIILKSDVFHPQMVHQMWAYIRCYMNEGPERLQNIKPFPRDVNFRRCLFGFFPFLDPTEDGRRIRAGMGRTEMIVSVAIASVLALALFWLFVPIGICEYIAQRLAPKPKWPAEVVQQTALRAHVTASA